MPVMIKTPLFQADPAIMAELRKIPIKELFRLPPLSAEDQARADRMEALRAELVAQLSANPNWRDALPEQFYTPYTWNRSWILGDV